jgi:hypothetical protein
MINFSGAAKVIIKPFSITGGRDAAAFDRFYAGVHLAGMRVHVPGGQWTPEI